MLRENRIEDPKYAEVERVLTRGLRDPDIGETGPWLNRGCIQTFSQLL